MPELYGNFLLCDWKLLTRTPYHIALPSSHQCREDRHRALRTARRTSIGSNTAHDVSPSTAHFRQICLRSCNTYYVMLQYCSSSRGSDNSLGCAHSKNKGCKTRSIVTTPFSSLEAGMILAQNYLKLVPLYSPCNLCTQEAYPRPSCTANQGYGTSFNLGLLPPLCVHVPNICGSIYYIV